MINKIRNCKKCNGTGYIRVGNDSWKRCPECYPIREKLQKYKNANIPEKFWNFEIENVNKEIMINTTKQKKIEINFKNLYQYYTKNIKKYINKGRGLYIAGDIGSGKTTLAILIGKYAIVHNYKVSYIKYYDVIEKYRDSWGSDNQGKIKQEINQTILRGTLRP